MGTVHDTHGKVQRHRLTVEQAAEVRKAQAEGRRPSPRLTHGQYRDAQDTLLSGGSGAASTDDTPALEVAPATGENDADGQALRQSRTAAESGARLCPLLDDVGAWNDDTLGTRAPALLDPNLDMLRGVVERIRADSHTEFVRLHQLGNAEGPDDELRRACNLLEFTDAFVDEHRPGVLTAWHARERLHCGARPGVFYLDPDASRSDALAYLGRVIHAIASDSQWPPEAGMTADCTTADVDEHRVSVTASSGYTGSRMTLVLDDSDCTTSPTNVLQTLLRIVQTPTHGYAVHAAIGPEPDCPHRLVFDLTSARHVGPLAERLLDAVGRHETVGRLIERQRDGRASIPTAERWMAEIEAARPVLPGDFSHDIPF